MSCASCAGNVEKMLKKAQGVTNASVNLASASVTVESVSKIRISILQQELSKSKFRIFDNAAEHLSVDNKSKQMFGNVIWSMVFSIPVFVLSMFFHHQQWTNYVMFVLSLPVIFYFGRRFFIDAYKEARNFSTNMDTLVALGSGTAFFTSSISIFFPNVFSNNGIEPFNYLESAVLIISFILLGKLMEERAKSRTLNSIKKLIGLQAKSAQIIRDDKEIEMPISQIVENDIVIVKPGEKIPVDGVVVDGETLVNESMLTGEATLCHKEKGSIVNSGTINTNGFIKVSTFKVGSETLLGKMISFVQQAQGTKANAQQLADKIASVFVPIVLAVSLMTFIIWAFLVNNPNITIAIVNATTVLVIACPCALGLATPTAVMVAVGRASEMGILVKNVRSFEKANNIDVLCLDKTGTITDGEISIVNWYNLPTIIEDKDLTVVLSAEKRAFHPLGAAMVHYLESLKIESAELSSFQYLQGKGIVCEFGTQTYKIGNEALVGSFYAILSQKEQCIVDEAKDNGYSILYITRDNKLISIISATDSLKAGIHSLVKHISDKGVDIHLLSGDNYESVSKTAIQAGISNYKSQMTPFEKAHYIQEIQNSGKKVAMVGDGINDAPALSQADISIAMHNGSDIALETADMTLLRGDLFKINSALNLSTYTNKIIYQNLFWAFFYNVVSIPIAAGALYYSFGIMLNPMIAASAMAFSSVSVVLNSLRLRAFK